MRRSIAGQLRRMKRSLDALQRAVTWLNKSCSAAVHSVSWLCPFVLHIRSHNNNIHTAILLSVALPGPEGSPTWESPVCCLLLPFSGRPTRLSGKVERTNKQTYKTNNAIRSLSRGVTCKSRCCSFTCVAHSIVLYVILMCEMLFM